MLPTITSLRLVVHFVTPRHVLAMSNTCTPLQAALKDCLLHSDCVLKQGHLPSECIREHTKELPEQCQALRQALFECKRSMVRTHNTFVKRVSDREPLVGHEETLPWQ